MKIKTRRYYIYNLAVIGGFLIAVLPKKLSLYLADRVGKIVFRILKKERLKMIDNLKSSFPEKTDAEIESIAKEVFSNLCRHAVELLNLYKLNRTNLDKWVKPEGLEKVDKVLSKGKGIVVLSSHFGNWELQAIFLALMGYRPVVIARKVYFDKYEAFISKARRSKGVEVVYRDESPKKILKALKKNRLLGILADQDVDSIDGVFVEFFGRQAYTPKAPVSFALASGAALVPGFTVKEGSHYRYIFEDPIEFEKMPTKEETIKVNTQKWTRVLESYIRKHPGHWVWMHKRWKTKSASGQDELK